MRHSWALVVLLEVHPLQAEVQASARHLFVLPGTEIAIGKLQNIIFPRMRKKPREQ